MRRLLPDQEGPAVTHLPRSAGGEVWAAHSLHVLSLEGDEITGATLFVDADPQPLFQALDLPLVLAAAAAAPTLAPVQR
jgi:hypothetical protein